MKAMGFGVAQTDGLRKIAIALIDPAGGCQCLVWPYPNVPKVSLSARLQPIDSSPSGDPS
jgi:hypothetical protein